MLLKLNTNVSCFKKYASCDPSQSSKEKEIWKNKKYTELFSLITFLNVDWYLSKHCRQAIFAWGSVPILDFLDQQEKFATFATCVAELTLVAKAAFIKKILCFEEFKILFGQLDNRKPPPTTCLESAPLAHFFGLTG